MLCVYYYIQHVTYVGKKDMTVWACLMRWRLSCGACRMNKARLCDDGGLIVAALTTEDITWPAQQVAGPVAPVRTNCPG